MSNPSTNKTSKETTIGERIRAQRTRFGMTQEEFASHLGFTRSYISQLESGVKEAGPRFVKKLLACEHSPNGARPYPQGSVEKATSIKEAGIRVMVREIPLISWAQAGIAARYEEIPEEWQEHIWAAVNDRQAFAIQLRGDSMEPKFSEGDVVVLMPNIPARNGDLVVANIVDEGFAFKILNVVGGDFQKLRLSSYNQAYPPMDYDREQFHWIYPVHSVNKVIRR